MAYTHNGGRPVTLQSDPIDPDSTEWVYFVYDQWLRAGETITAHSALVEGGTLVTDSVYLGALSDVDGTAYSTVYGVQVTPDAGATQVQVTHRVTTTTSDTPPLSRVNVDRTAILLVRSL